MKDIEDNSILEEVMSLYDKYDFENFTAHDVETALSKDSLSFDDFAALLSTAATPYIEKMAQKAQTETRRQFGNTISLFTPLYIANYCENECVYCGFNCRNKIHRAKLSMEEIEKEYQTISATGLQDILILTGESRHMSDIDYIGDAIELAKKYFSTISIEIYPVDLDEYKYLHQKGADFVCVYQETYNREKYDEIHVRGPKKVFSYRFNAQERALLAGMRGVAFGALLGLDDFRRDAFSAGIHAFLIQKRYPHAEISFSVPRLRPYINNSKNNPHDVHETQLLQVMTAFRLLLPYAGITISTRERAGFRDNVVGMCATKISAGVSVGVGGHSDEEKGDEQFEISDPRSVDEVKNMLHTRGLQPIFTDYIRLIG